jgi:hypothetical protein
MISDEDFKKLNDKLNEMDCQKLEENKKIEEHVISPAYGVSMNIKKNEYAKPKFNNLGTIASVAYCSNGEKISNELPETPKNKLIEKWEKVSNLGHGARLIVTVVTLPSGALEVITNYQKLDEKMEYLINAYDDNLVLKSCPQIKLLDCIIL